MFNTINTFISNDIVTFKNILNISNDV